MISALIGRSHQGVSTSWPLIGQCFVHPLVPDPATEAVKVGWLVEVRMGSNVAMLGSIMVYLGI